MDTKQRVLEKLDSLQDEEDNISDFYNKPQEISYGCGFRDGLKRAIFCIKVTLEKEEEK